MPGRFWRDQRGQDLLEYTLLMGFVALAAAAVFPRVAENIQVIWTVIDKHLRDAAEAARRA